MSIAKILIMLSITLSLCVQSIYSMEIDTKEHDTKECIIKKHIEQYQQSVGSSGYKMKFTQWNEQDDQCHVVLFEKGEENYCFSDSNHYLKSKILVLRKYILTDENINKSLEGRWSHCIRGLSQNQPPIITKDGDFIFYACGYETKFVKTSKPGKLKENPNKEIFQYGLSPTGERIKKQCRIALDNTGVHYTLMDFIDFPNLLKAILNSCIKTEYNYNLLGTLLIHRLRGVKLLDDYAVCSKIHSRYKSFDELPGHIRKPIVQHYELQKFDALSAWSLSL